MREYSVVMALVDYIPVIFFAIAGVLMLKDFYYKMTKYGFATFAAGIINVFCAGFLKATWKLLYAMGVCDFEALNHIFLPMQSLGFLLAGVALLLLICRKKKALYAVAIPPVFKGTVVFLSMMVVGLGLICTVLGIVAGRKKKPLAVVLFVLAFLFSMGMGYAGRLDPTLAWVNWLEQGINIGSQACLLGGMLILHRAIGEERKEA